MMKQRGWYHDFEAESSGEASIYPSHQKPLTVGELASKIRYLLENEFSAVRVEGEVTGFKVAQSGHAYFSLKDEQAIIDCVIWRRRFAQLSYLPSDGEHVEISGSVTTYVRGSRYEIIVTSIQPAGLGRLYQKFIELKERLEREGLFDASRKRPLPPYPKTVGVITSPKGAAIRDIIKVLRRRAPQIRIVVYPTAVQGDEAPQRIAAAIKRMNELGLVDILIVGRGGGSLEDLWAFNEEIVARAIANSKIPIISAVGHETDFTIADFVADERAPTPSAAAEMVAPNRRDLLHTLKTAQRRLQAAVDRRLAPLRRVYDLRQRLVHAVRRRMLKLTEARHFPQRAAELVRRRMEKLRRAELMQERLRSVMQTHVRQRLEVCRRFELHVAKLKPLQRLNERRQQLDDLTEQTQRLVRLALREQQHRLELLMGKLSSLDPKAILGRGYSITFDAHTNRVLTSATNTRVGQSVRIVLSEGEIGARVESRHLPTKDKHDGVWFENELPLDAGATNET